MHDGRKINTYRDSLVNPPVCMFLSEELLDKFWWNATESTPYAFLLFPEIDKKYGICMNLCGGQNTSTIQFRVLQWCTVKLFLENSQ